MAVIIQAALPQVSIAGRPVQTAAFVNVIEFVLPCWIVVRAMLLVWPGLAARLAILTIGPVAVGGVLFAYMIPMPGSSFTGTIPPLTAAEQEASDRLRGHVDALAGAIGERHEGAIERLRAAADYVEATLAALGYEVFHHTYEYGGRTFENLEVVLRGRVHLEEIVVVGGHYDTVEGTPGAADNASGTAAVLELARLLRNDEPERTVRFVAFVNEEPPFFSTRWMGSWQYAARAADRQERIVAMVSLETLGFFQHEAGSQRYPPPFSFFYPDVGNFVAFVGNLPSRPLVRRSIAVFRQNARFPSEGIAAPEQIPGVWWSDHAPFWVHGFRAIMITDTAPFRNPHYHRSSDTPERLDYVAMARVVAGVAEVVRDLIGTAAANRGRL